MALGEKSRAVVYSSSMSDPGFRSRFWRQTVARVWNSVLLLISANKGACIQINSVRSYDGSCQYFDTIRLYSVLLNLYH